MPSARAWGDLAATDGARPTNSQLAVAHVDRSPEAVIRQACREQGCTCGDDLQVHTRPLRPEERPEGTEDYGRATGAEVSHRLDCPLLARVNGVN